MKKTNYFRLCLTAVSATLIALTTACTTQQVDAEDATAGGSGRATNLSVELGAVSTEVEGNNIGVRNPYLSGDSEGGWLDYMIAETNHIFSSIEVFIGSANRSDGANGCIYRRFKSGVEYYTMGTGPASTYGTILTASSPKETLSSNAIKVNTDAVRVHTMINADLTDEGYNISDWIRQKTNPDEQQDRFFREKYDLNATNLDFSLSNLSTFFPTAPKTAVSKVAKYANKQEKVLATSHNYYPRRVYPDITATQTLSSHNDGEAYFGISVSNRIANANHYVAARAYVTSSVGTATTPYIVKNGTEALGSVESLRYVIGQGERAIYIGRSYLETSNDGSTKTYDTHSHGRPESLYRLLDENLSRNLTTPAFDYEATTYDAIAGDSGAFAYYDYATLWMDPNGGGSATVNTPAQLNAGTPVIQRNAPYEMADISNTGAPELYNNMFFLPTRHKRSAYYDSGSDVFYHGDKTTGYRKGNTAYVLVRGKFTPATFADEGQSLWLSEFNGVNEYQMPSGATAVTSTTQTLGDPPGTFYYTSDGKFFHTIEGAIKSFNATKPLGSNPEDKVATYTEDGTTAYYIPSNRWVKRYPAGKMLWVLWMNPSSAIEDEQYWDSGTAGGSIYTIHIKGVTGMGANWNSLVPLPFDDGVASGGVPGVNQYRSYYNKFNPDPNPNFDPRFFGYRTPYVTVPDPIMRGDGEFLYGINKDEDALLPFDPHDYLPNHSVNMSVEVGVLPWSKRSYTVTF